MTGFEQGFYFALAIAGAIGCLIHKSTKMKEISRAERFGFASDRDDNWEKVGERNVTWREWLDNGGWGVVIIIAMVAFGSLAGTIQTTPTDLSGDWL